MNNRMHKYVKKPITVDAFQWDGSPNIDFNIPDKDLAKYFDYNPNRKHKLHIKTLEGYEKVPVGSYIIRGVKGEYYCCDQEIFEETYRRVK